MNRAQLTGAIGSHQHQLKRQQAQRVNRLNYWVQQHRTGTESCPTCNGTGRRLLVKCSDCLGHGIVPVVICPKCGGTGKGIFFLCGLCNGHKAVAGWRILKDYFNVV
jgi:DnaJ-class molecular chaperone